MPNTLWRVARREIMRPLGLVQFATTTDIAATDNAISTSLSARFPRDDYFIGWYFTIVLDVDGGTPANGLGTTTRRIEDYTGSSGDLDLVLPILSAEDEAVDCDLYRFHPDDIQRAYNRARQKLYPNVFTVKNLETLVTGQMQHTFTIPSTMRHIDGIYLGNRATVAGLAQNLFTDPGLEDWTNATTLASWTLVGSGSSINQEVQTTNPKNYMVLEGGNSGRLAVALNTLTTLLQIVTPSVATQGVECNVSAYVYSNVASRVAIRIAGVDGTAHTGTGWERIVSAATIAATATSVAAGISASSGAAMSAFADEFSMTLGPSEVLDSPWIPLADWRRIAAVDGASNHGSLYIARDLPEGRRLKIEGRDILSSVALDTDTFEVDGELLDVLYDQCRAYLCEERSELEKEDASGLNEGAWSKRSRRYQNAVDTAIQNGVGLSLVPTRKLTIPNA